MLDQNYVAVPGCVKSTQSTIEISWTVKSDREYSYIVRGGGRKFSECNSKIHNSLV